MAEEPGKLYFRDDIKEANFISNSERKNAMKLKDRIAQYVDAGFPILYLNTFEDVKAQDAIFRAAKQVHGTQIRIWDGTDRICDETGAVTYRLTQDISLAEILDDRMTFEKPQFVVFKNIDTFIDSPSVLARIKKMASMIHAGTLEATIFVISPILRIPKEIEKYVTVLEMDYLSMEEIQEFVRTFLMEQGSPIGKDLERQFAQALKGLSELEIQNILQLACSRGELTSEQIHLIFEQKQQMIKKAGILEMIPLKEGLEDIGGLENLKDWLKRKAKVIKNMDEAKNFGVDMPKGVLIAGVPGCGKSLSAKSAAKLFDIPLLRMDMGRLLGKYVGESEANMRKAIELAEAISPCVLWIDELEKAFAGINGDGAGAEVTTRLFGSFLTWLQEKESPVFVVATANNLMKLPPELLRKGRFDEVFYVGLPKAAERQKIFEIHIGKRRKGDLPEIGKSMKTLVEKTEGYSGADIEGVVRESVEVAFSKGRNALAADDILQVINQTHSLSEIMGDSIEKMKKEYEQRKFKNASRG